MSTEDSPSKSPLSLLLLGLVLLVGGGLRFWNLGGVPPGIWFDEALDAQDAVNASQGDFKMIYPEVFPREPVYVTTIAIVTWFAGPSVTAYRATSAVFGILTLVTLFFCVRAFAGDETALAATAALATMRWHVIFSRLLFRTLLMPLVISLIVLAAKATRDRPTFLRALILGVLVGCGFYTYLSWYFMLPGIVALLTWVFWPARSDRASRRAVVVFCIFFALTSSPILIHYVRYPDHLLARPDAVSPFKEGNAIHEISKNFLQALGMFNYSGDHVPKHNIPRAPALNPIEGLFFLAGLAICIWGIRRRCAFALVLVAWLLLGVMPTIFTKTDSPNFLRTLVVTPAVAMMTAIGLIAFSRRLARAFPRLHSKSIAPSLILGWLILSGGWTARQVFAQWANSQEVWQSFNGDFSQLGKAAAETPDGTTFWVPTYLNDHRSFQFLSDPSHIRNRVRSYANFDFLRAGSDVGPRRIVATAHNMIYPVLRDLAPKGHVIQEFKTPDNRTWALLFEISPADLPSTEMVAQAEAAHPADVRW